MGDFSSIIDATTAADLRAKGSRKWTTGGPDDLGAFIAEMDFGVAPPIAEALRDHVAAGALGYLPGWMDDELAVACAEFQRDRFGWEIDPRHVHSVSDVVKVLEIELDHFTRSSGAVILPTPAYMPFFEVPPTHGRRTIEVPCHEDNGYFTLDLDGIDAAFAAGGELLVLCNPHNPVGRVLSRAELEAVCEIVDKHHGRVFADEIHAPLTYDDAPAHIPYVSISDTAARHTITGTSASKAFNLPGLKCAVAITSNERDAEIWASLPGIVAHGSSTIGAVATIAAYRDGGLWLDEARRYLADNREELTRLVAEKLPGVQMRPPDGTYLAWLDFRACDLAGGQAGPWLAEHAGVIVNEGATFGAPGRGFARLNLATPRPVLREIIDRIAVAVSRR